MKKTPKYSTSELRQIAASSRKQLQRNGARCRKPDALTLLDHIEALCSDLDDASALVADLRPYRELYASLTNDWNGACELMRGLGIDCYQPSLSSAWHWRYGEASGEAPTIAEAWGQALAAAGARPKEAAHEA